MDKKKDILTPQQSQLPAVKVTDLKLDKIDLLTRSILDEDLLQENIFIVYSDKLIGFLCLTPALLVIDGESFFCTSKHLIFRKIPEL